MLGFEHRIGYPICSDYVSKTYRSSMKYSSYRQLDTHWLLLPQSVAHWLPNSWHSWKGIVREYSVKFGDAPFEQTHVYDRSFWYYMSVSGIQPIGTLNIPGCKCLHQFQQIPLEWFVCRWEDKMSIDLYTSYHTISKKPCFFITSTHIFLVGKLTELGSILYWALAKATMARTVRDRTDMFVF